MVWSDMRSADNLKNELLRIIYFLHGRTGTFWLIVFRVSRKNLELLTSVQGIVFFRLAPPHHALLIIFSIIFFIQRNGKQTWNARQKF